MTIRPYEDDDLAELLDVWHRASLLAHPFLSEDFLANERDQIAQHWLPMAETSVYESGGRVIGFLSLIDNEVGGLFVDPDQQRRSVGRALMDLASSLRPFLELSVFEGNPIGRRFYDAYGFACIGRQIDGDSGEPELRLRLDRGNTPAPGAADVDGSKIDSDEEE